MWRLFGSGRCGATAVGVPAFLRGALGSVARVEEARESGRGRMVGGIPPMVVVLPAGTLMRMPTGGEVVELVEGELWVTREGDGLDHVLRQGGERYEVDGCGRVVLQALSDVRMRVWGR